MIMIMIMLMITNDSEPNSAAKKGIRVVSCPENKTNLV